jgi:sugar lactone lactonase YvrE
MEFRLALDSRTVLAETPIWDSRLRKLYWTDLFSGTVHRYDPSTGIDDRAETHSLIGAAIPCDTVGKLLVAVDDGMMLLDFESGRMDLIAVPQPNTGEFRYNDTRCDAAGRIFTSTVSKKYADPDFDPETMTGKFYMVDVDGTVVTLVDKIIQYNTIFFNSENRNLYAVDTFHKKLLRFDYSLERGARGEPQPVIEFDEMPDGVAVDSEDHIYVCHWSDKRQISVWSLKDYALVRTIPFPVKHICCPGFGGDDMKDFYVATSRFWLPDGDSDLEAGAGGLFVARSEIPGRPEHFYHDRRNVPRG